MRLSYKYTPYAGDFAINDAILLQVYVVNVKYYFLTGR